MKIIGVSILWICILGGCSDEKIEITNEYIINENWSKKNEEAWANSITINKMKVRKDSTINAFSDLSQAEILDKLEEDSSFMYYANVKIQQGESYKNKKIFFNRYNGFYWGSKRFNNDDTTKTIGNLRQDSWYKFSDLGLISHSYIYVYIDSANKSHRFVVNLANY
jgi:hypothetical protein